ncbi:cerebellin 18 [Larimichthys crocea]|uniref:cerebellin 18 n=1 Tax=Larimichthys crocea TaxID=215358 RepID=UPI00054AFEED|nr:cerebellin-2-like [Larimichthys crocea]
MIVLPVLFLLGSLFLCRPVEASSQSGTIQKLKDAALSAGSLSCKWDCNCTYNRQRSCCCAADDMYKLEETTFLKLVNVWGQIKELNADVEECTKDVKIAFSATIDPSIAVSMPGTSERCFGPFNTNVPIPYSIVSLNSGSGFNPTMGIFTAPRAGVYLFSFTAYSYVERGERLYHKVQLMKNGAKVVSVWENNREDGEDSATQVVILEMNRGDQVYVELTSGRKLCNSLQYNIFTGYMVYPSHDM